MNSSSTISITPGTSVLVTGATGYTGSVLIRKLASQGARVRAVARSSSNIGPFADLDIEWIRGDVFDPNVISTACQDIEVVFHVAAAYREAKITDETYRNVHIQSTKLLAEALAGKPQFKRFVHISTVGVHGHIDKPPADESYPFNPGDIYQRTKAEAELWIREFSSSAGLPLTVIRPAAIYGPGDRRLLKVFKLAAKRFFPLFGSGRGLYHLIHVEDLTDIFILAAHHKGALGEVFIAGNKEPSELKEIARTIADELGNHRIRFIRLPAWPLFALALLCEGLCRPFGIEPPLYRRRVAFFTKDRAFNTNKLSTVLGFTNRVKVSQGLRATARWYREAGWLS
jgi:nucleoside-diphosphate-sugar epimerase